MKLKKLSLATLMAMTTSGTVFASAGSLPVGPNLGYGDASNNNTIFSTTANPAWISGNLHVENNVGLGLTAGIKFEQKDFDTLNAQYKADVKPILDNFNDSTQSAIVQATLLETNINNLILDIRDKFYFQADAQVDLPLVFTRNGWGGFGIELSGSSSGRGQFLSSDRPATLDAGALTGSNLTDADLVEALDIKAAIYLKTATMTEGALTYGNQFYKNEDGQLSIGIRAKYMQASLVKSVNSFKKYLRQTANNQDITIADDLSKHSDITNTDTNFGVDIGAQWFAENWMAGLSIQNVNSPQFSYNTLGVGTTDQANIEKYYADQYQISEKVELKAQAKLEAAYFSQNRHWTIAGSADLNESNDLLNQKQQWVSVGASYASDSSNSAWYYALIPDVRIGYRSNLAGDKQHYYTPGLSWGPLNLDLAFAEFDDLTKLTELSSNADENSKLPQGVQINLGLEFYF